MGTWLLVVLSTEVFFLSLTPAQVTISLISFFGNDFIGVQPQALQEVRRARNPPVLVRDHNNSLLPHRPRDKIRGVCHPFTVILGLELVMVS